MIDKIRKICIDHPERYKRIQGLFTEINESGIDIRKLEYLKHKIFNPLEKAPSLTQFSIADFKTLVSKALGAAASLVVDYMA